MSIRRTIKLIKKSKVLTEKEKTILIRKGLTETIINSYKEIIKLPFFLVGASICLLCALLEKITEGLYFIEQFPHSVFDLLENKLPELSLTKKEPSREKFLKEIRTDNCYVHTINANDICMPKEID